MGNSIPCVLAVNAVVHQNDDAVAEVESLNVVEEKSRCFVNIHAVCVLAVHDIGRGKHVSADLPR